MKKFLVPFILALFLSASVFAEITAFQIGKPDARAAEFKHFRGLDDMRFQYMTGYDEKFRAYR